MRSIDQLEPTGNVEIPIADRPWPAGSGIDDFPTPTGVRNSKRKLIVCFRHYAGNSGRSFKILATSCNRPKAVVSGVAMPQPYPVTVYLDTQDYSRFGKVVDGKGTPKDQELFVRLKELRVRI